MGARAGAVAILVAGLLAGCGTEEQAEEAIVISHTSPPHRLDPALSDAVNSWEPLWLVYTPLLTYRHADGSDGAELIPGLANDLPEVSDDGTVYELELRDQLEYSDGTEVRASDFEHTIRRVLELDSPGVPFYDGIAGAREYLRGGDPEADITGIEADDETGEITITLTAPDATFSNVLAMSFAGLVPGDTAFRDLTSDPPPGVGAYELVDVSPDGQFVLERNEAFERLDIPDIPTGNLDRITTRIAADKGEQARDVLAGELDYMQDRPPPELRPTVLEQAGDRYAEHPSVPTYYFFLNHRTAPFDDPKVRAAVNYGLDRAALARLYAGAVAPGCGFLAPGIPGYDEELDTEECPYGNPEEGPDTTRARELVAEAGATATRVTVWGSDEAGARAATRAYAEMLDEIGLDAEPRIVDPAGYDATVGSRRTRAQTGLALRDQDFPHPLSFYAAVDGDEIRATGNENLGNVDDPFVNQEIDRLRQETEVDADEWEELESHLIDPEEGHLAPFGHGQIPTFLSERIEPESAIFHPLYRNDYSSWELKEGE